MFQTILSNIFGVRKSDVNPLSISIFEHNKYEQSIIRRSIVGGLIVGVSIVAVSIYIIQENFLGTPTLFLLPPSNIYREVEEACKLILGPG